MEYSRLSEIDIHSNINKRIFVKFMVLDVEVRMQKDKITKYIKFTICDKGVKLDCCKFGATQQDIDSIANGKVYHGAIDIKEYAKAINGISGTIYNIEPIEESSSDYAEWADGIRNARDIIQEALANLSNSSSVYRELVYNILLQHWKQFSTWTAASSMHHNTLGGLLVHTAEVVEQANAIADLWNIKYGNNFINKDLLTAGALLHDIAKVQELNVDTLSGKVEYSDISALETHVTMSLELITAEAIKLSIGIKTESKSDEQVEKEQEALRLLKHCVLSHHGKLEYGSPIEPHCPEAYILYIADNISAEMFRYNRAFKELKANKANMQSAWINGKIVTIYKESTKE